MNERTKRLLAVAGFAVSVIGIGAALYVTFFRGAPPVEPGPTVPVLPPPDGTGGLIPGGPAGERPPGVVPEVPGVLPPSPVAQGGLTQTTPLTTGPVAQTTLAGDGRSVNYYDPADGRFYTIDADGNVRRLSDRAFPQVQTVEWNRTAEKAVLEFPDGSNIVYDFATQTQTSLPAHWEDFGFSPVRDELVTKSMALDPNNRWMVTVNADGSNARAFQALGNNADKVQVAWSPNDQVVAFSDTGGAQGAADRRMIIPVGKNQENFKGLIVEGYSFLPLWSTDGSKLVYSAAGSYSELRPLLWAVDGTPSTMGENRRSLGLNTWADKCTFGAANALYCAVPRDLPGNAGLMRSMFRSYPDLLYKVDLTTGRTFLLATPATDTTMENLKVSADESELFYTNAATGQLERIRLR